MSERIDITNTFLLLFAFLFSFFFPFELFLLSYAVLGPLHYLTEINWLKEKKYFSTYKYWARVCLLTAFIIFTAKVIPYVYTYIGEMNTTTKGLIHFIDSYSNILILLCLALSVLYSFKLSRERNLLFTALILFIAISVNSISGIGLWIGIMLPTIIHVFFFTFAFMCYGYLKYPNKIGAINLVLFLILPLFLFILPYHSNWDLSQYVKESYMASDFYILPIHVLNLLGITEVQSFDFSSPIIRKIQMFICFAYTYHYLNWFSKTSLIGWGNNLSWKITGVIGITWLISVLLYAFDYRLGMIALIFLSYSHVFMELPLNVLSLKTIVKYYAK